VEKKKDFIAEVQENARGAYLSRAGVSPSRDRHKFFFNN